MKKGLIHIYTGEGKGKTTASIGLAIRAAGQGLTVLLVQFFKSDKDSSGELNIIRERIPEIEMIRMNERHPLFKKEERPGKIKDSVEETFREAVDKALHGDYDLLVMDEIHSAVAGNWLAVEEVIGFLKHKPEKLEVVMTGRKAHDRLVEMADYVTEMNMQKHPYEKGVTARKGIEYEKTGVRGQGSEVSILSKPKTQNSKLKTYFRYRRGPFWKERLCLESCELHGQEKVLPGNSAGP